MSEAYPLMLSTAPVLRKLPDLSNTTLDWLPVDTAAGAVKEIAFRDTVENHLLMTASLGTDDDVEEGCRVLHVLNPYREPRWGELLRVVGNCSPELAIEMVPPGEWLEALEDSESDVKAKKLVGLWRDAISSSSSSVQGIETGGSAGETEGERETGASFATEKTRVVSAVMREIEMLDAGFLARVWAWVLKESKSSSGRE